MRVAIVMPPALMADEIRCAWMAGHTPVPLDPDDPQLDTKLDATDWHILKAEKGTQARDAVLPGDPTMGLILFTSGSTGDCKGVVLSRAAIEGNARSMWQHHGRPERLVTCLSPYHCNSVCGSILAAEILGLDLHVFPVEGYLDSIRAIRSPVRFANVVPAVIELILDEDADWPDNLGYLLTAAAPLTSALAKRFADRYGESRLVQGYGMTEAVNFTLTMPPAGAWPERYLSKHPPVGVAIPGCAVRVVDGELQVRGHIMDGYWQRPDLTSERIVIDSSTGMKWLRSGDAAEVDDGGMVVLQGRLAESVNWRGAVTYPSAFEEAWGEGVAVPVTSLGLMAGEHPGIVGVDARDALRLEPSPLACDSTLIARTSTGKPQRRQAGSRMSCRYESQASYGRLLSRSREVAARIVAGPRPTDPALSWAYQRALELTQAVPAGTLRGGRSAASDWLDAIEVAWPDARGHTDGLWIALMREWPMGAYGALVADVIKRRLPAPLSAALEIGHGVGNTSRHLNGIFGDTWVKTDINPAFGLPWDIDTPAPLTVSTERYDVIYATNVLHCSKDPVAALRRLRKLMNPGGMIVLGEGEPAPGGAPWALTWAFGVMDGWWDRGGFRTRSQWLAALSQAGFRGAGYAVYRAGRYDLGGALWAHL